MNSIPNYPIFQDLGIHHQAEINSIVRSFEPYSDFNFVSLFCWNTDNTAKVSILNGNLVIKLPDYLTGEEITSVKGTNKIDATVRQLLEDHNQLKLVPEIVITQLNADSLSIDEDIDNHDYIYAVDELADLKGGKYKKKRNKLASVRNELSDKIRHEFKSGFNDKDKAVILDILSKWNDETKQSDEDSSAEITAINNLLSHVDHLNLRLLTVHVNEVAVAFSINEILDGGYAICHFEKVLKIHDQLNVYVVNHLARSLREENVRFHNWEQDLGIEGMRLSKSSYGPIKHLKKYTITVK